MNHGRYYESASYDDDMEDDGMLINGQSSIASSFHLDTFIQDGTLSAADLGSMPQLAAGVADPYNECCLEMVTCLEVDPTQATPVAAQQVADFLSTTSTVTELRLCTYQVDDPDSVRGIVDQWLLVLTENDSIEQLKELDLRGNAASRKVLRDLMS